MMCEQVKELLELARQAMQYEKEPSRELITALATWLKDQSEQLAAANAKITEQAAALELGQENCDDAYDDLRDELAAANATIEAANARVAELETERQRDALDGQAALDEANNRIATLEQELTAQDMLIEEAKKGAEIMTERAEQAEAQCAAMRNCDNCNKWCMKQPNKSELDTLNRMDDCKFNNLSHWELSKKIEAALEGKP